MGNLSCCKSPTLAAKLRVATWGAGKICPHSDSKVEAGQLYGTQMDATFFEAPMWNWFSSQISIVVQIHVSDSSRQDGPCDNEGPKGTCGTKVGARTGVGARRRGDAGENIQDSNLTTQGNGAACQAGPSGPLQGNSSKCCFESTKVSLGFVASEVARVAAASRCLQCQQAAHNFGAFVVQVTLG